MHSEYSISNFVYFCCTIHMKSLVFFKRCKCSNTHWEVLVKCAGTPDKRTLSLGHVDSFLSQKRGFIPAAWYWISRHSSHWFVSIECDLWLWVWVCTHGHGADWSVCVREWERLRTRSPCSEVAICIWWSRVRSTLLALVVPCVVSVCLVSGQRMCSRVCVVRLGGL